VTAANDPRLHLLDLRTCIGRIREYTRGGRGQFLGSPLLQDAVIRNFEVMGEAAKRLPDALRRAHPAVPWRRICGFRDVLIHQYSGVDLEAVWEVVEKDLAPLEAEVEAMLAEAGGAP